MIAYADSSALAKLYLDEPGRDQVLGLGTLVASSLAAVEVCSAIWRKQRLGELAAGDAGVLADRALAELSGGSTRVVVIPPTTRLLVDASLLTGTAGLRAYDALQLATARAAREAMPDVAAFACFDRVLSGAAAAHGFALPCDELPA